MLSLHSPSLSPGRAVGVPARAKAGAGLRVYREPVRMELRLSKRQHTYGTVIIPQPC